MDQSDDFISLLPEDVRKLLFEFMMQVDKKKLLELRGVCKLWDGVIEGNLTGWTALECDLARSEPYVTTFWTKMPIFVRKTPATIVIHNIGGPESQPLDLCLLETKAIKCLVLYIAHPEGLVQIASIFKERATKPPIELALVGTHGCTQMQWPINILANFPPVSKLCLDGFSSGFGQDQSLAHIPSLLLGDTMNKQIFKILPFTPNLECLDIRGFRCFLPAEKIRLSKLHTLKTVYLHFRSDHLESTELKHLTIQNAGPSLIAPGFIQNCPLIETLALGGTFDVAEVNSVAPNVKKLHLLHLTVQLQANAFFPPFLPLLTEIIIHTPNVKLDKETFIALVKGRCRPFCESGMQKLIIQTVKWDSQDQDGWWNTELYMSAKEEIIVLDSDNDPCCSMGLSKIPRCIQVELTWL